MPRPPRFSSAAQYMPGAVYSPFSGRSRSGPLYPLHVGDTWLEPCEGARAQDLRTEDCAGLHRYSETRGLPALVDALVEKLRVKNELACERESLLVTAGATAALACAAGALLEPGDEVLILAPFWPLIRGIVRSVGGVPVEVPFYDRIERVDEALEALGRARGPRTVALYVSTPSNPTGIVLERAMLEALAEWARREDLWLLSDEVYEDFVYRGEHVSLAALAPERALGFYSFSKAYGMAGCRIGYLVGPPEAVAQVHKFGTHSFYCAPTPSQWAALHALRDGGAWQRHARALYRRAGDIVAERLSLPPPAGSTFFFVDVRSRLDDRGPQGFLEDCFERGVLVAPGDSSGRDYAGWIRLCYTVLPSAEIERAVEVLAELLGC